MGPSVRPGWVHPACVHRPGGAHLSVGDAQVGCHPRTGAWLFTGWAGQGEGLLTCHGRVAQETCDFLLAELLLLVSQQLVDELPKNLLDRRVQHRVDVHDEGVDVPGGGRRSKGFMTQGSPWGEGEMDKGALPGHRTHPCQDREVGKVGRQALAMPPPIQILALPLTSQVTFLRLLNSPVPQFPLL